MSCCACVLVVLLLLPCYAVANVLATGLQIDVAVDVILLNLPQFAPARLVESLEGLRGDSHISVTKGAIYMGARFHVRSESAPMWEPARSPDELSSRLADMLSPSPEVFSLVFMSVPNITTPEYCAPVWVSAEHRLAVVNLDDPCEYGPASGPGYVSLRRQFQGRYSELAALCHRVIRHVVAPSLDNPHPAETWVRTIRLMFMWDARENAAVDANVRHMVEAVNPLVDVVSMRVPSCEYCDEAWALSQGNATVLFSLLHGEMGSASDEFTVFVVDRPVEGGGPDDVFVFARGALLVGAETRPPNSMVWSSVALVEPRRLDARVFGAVLRGVFAVAPSYLRWSSARHRFVSDFLFAVGHTPFGPFSRSATLSRPLKDAAKRNPIVAHLAETLTLARSHGEASEDLDRALRRAAVLLGLYEFHKAAIFAIQARRHLEAVLLKGGVSASQGSRVLECATNDNRGSEGYGLAGLIGVGALAFIYDQWIVWSKQRRRRRASGVGGVPPPLKEKKG